MLPRVCPWQPGLGACQVGKSFAGPRDALAMNGTFILAQMERWDGPTAPALKGPFALTLRQEV